MDFLITNEALFYSFLLLLMLHVKHFLVNAIIVKPKTRKESLDLLEISAGLIAWNNFSVLLHASPWT